MLGDERYIASGGYFDSDDEDDVVDATYERNNEDVDDDLEPDYEREDADIEDSLSYIEREDYDAAEDDEDD